MKIKIKRKELSVDMSISRKKEFSKREFEKRNKTFINFTKKYQNQLIITMPTCKKSLQFSYQHNEKLKQSIGKYKKPNILFDYSKYYRNKSVWSLESVFSLSDMGMIAKLDLENRIKKRKERNTHNEGLSRNMPYIPKQLYQKFLKNKREEKNKNLFFSNQNTSFQKQDL